MMVAEPLLIGRPLTKVLILIKTIQEFLNKPFHLLSGKTNQAFLA